MLTENRQKKMKVHNQYVFMISFFSHGMLVVQRTENNGEFFLTHINFVEMRQELITNPLYFYDAQTNIDNRPNVGVTRFVIHFCFDEQSQWQWLSHGEIDSRIPATQIEKKKRDNNKK